MRLEELSLEHEAAYLAMTADYRERDPKTFALRYNRDWTQFEFRKFLKTCEHDRMDWRPKAGKVSLTRYVLIDDSGEICGNGLLRFPLDTKTELDGGNLEFDVPPSKRGRQFGAITLNKMLFEAVRAGLARALVTCLADDARARNAIEMNRGELQDEVKSARGLIARYWIRFRR